MTFRTELEAYIDYPMTATCISHTHHASSLSITENKLDTEAFVAYIRTLKVPQVRLQNGPYVAKGQLAIDRATERRSCHHSLGQCTHLHMGTNSKQLHFKSMSLKY